MTPAARPVRRDVDERIALATALLRAYMEREPTLSEVLAQLSDADVDSLGDDPTEELQRESSH